MANKMAKASEEESWVVPPEYYVPLMDTFMAFSEAWTKAAPNVDKNSYTKLVEFKSLLSQIESMLIDDFGANVEEIVEALVAQAMEPTGRELPEDATGFEFVHKGRLGGWQFFHVTRDGTEIGHMSINEKSQEIGKSPHGVLEFLDEEEKNQFLEAVNFEFDGDFKFA